MTASSILRSRRDSSCEAISANLGTTSNHCQVTCEAVETKPAQGGENEPVAVDDRAPSFAEPWTSTNKFRTGETQAVRRSQPQVYAFRVAIVLVPFVGRLAHQSTVAPLAQRRCWLRRQAVKRDVRRLQGERRGYVVRPAARHLVR